MSIKGIRENFGAVKAAAVGGIAALWVPFAAANAQEAPQAQPQQYAQAATTQTVGAPASAVTAAAAAFTPIISDDANRSAAEWSVTNPGMSVAVKLGTDSKITPARIHEVLTKEMNAAGLEDAGLKDQIAFFFEQNDTPSTGVRICYTGNCEGPYWLNESKDAARKWTQQYLFEQSRPELAFNYPQQ